MSGTNLTAATGRLLILSGPSDVGKQTVINGALAAHPDLGTLITATTRAPRPGEKDGVHYHFLSHERFHQMAAAGEMVEWNEYAGNYYGTPMSSIEPGLLAGRMMIGDVDINGVRNLKALYGDLVVYVQLLPPGGDVDSKLNALSGRILVRSPELVGTPVLRQRLDTAREELLAMATPEVARLTSRRIVNRHVGPTVRDLSRLISELKAHTLAPVGE